MSEKTDRQRYMDHDLTHSEYYGLIVADLGLSYDDHSELDKWAQWYAEDEHMNQPGDGYWDRIALSLNRSKVHRVLRAHGDGWSHCADTCIIKEAVRQAISRR